MFLPTISAGLGTWPSASAAVKQWTLTGSTGLTTIATDH